MIRIAVAATMAVFVLGLAGPPQPTAAGLPVLKEIGTDFQLLGPRGRAFRLKDFRGKVVMLSFGYTHCPDVCPTTLQKLARVRKGLKGKAKDLRLLFITLDPERDTPQVLEKYVAFFGESILGLTGTRQQIKAVAAGFKTVFRKNTGSKSKAGYLISHGDFIYLLDRAGRTRALYHHNTPTWKISADVYALVARRG